MGIDLKAIDRRIKVLQRVREIAAECERDPEFKAMLAEIVAPNGNKPTAPKAAPVAESKPSGSERPRGYFIGAVSGAVAESRGDFTSTDIEKVIRSKGIEILANNPTVSINDALKTLEQRGQVVRSGKRGVAVLWKKAISAVESRTA